MVSDTSKTAKINLINSVNASAELNGPNYIQSSSLMEFVLTLQFAALLILIAYRSN